MFRSKSKASPTLTTDLIQATEQNLLTPTILPPGDQIINTDDNNCRYDMNCRCSLGVWYSCLACGDSLLFWPLNDQSERGTNAIDQQIGLSG